jgi:hypothetical protein
MNNQLKSYIWISVLAMVFVFVGFISSNRVYKSETDVLIIPKSETTAKNISRIANNAKELPKSLDFYDQLISQDGTIKDEFEGLPGYKRKAYWQSKIKTEAIDDSSIVRITVFDKDQTRSGDLSEKAGLTLAVFMSRYYDIKTELDIRISDGPVTSYAFRENIFILFGKSLFWGTIFGFLVYGVDYILKKTKIGRERTDAKKRTRRNIFLKTVGKIDAGPITFDKKPADFKKSAETFSAPEKKSAAPVNLPVADGLAMSEDQEKTGKKKEDGPIIREATPEEVKERLNKLLRGDL